MLEALKKHDRVDNFEAETTTHTGRHIYVIFSARLDDGHISGMVMDITARKTSELKIQKYQTRLKALAVQLTVVEEQERRRIAEDLHDNISQSLVFSRMQLSNLQNQSSDEKSQELIDEISQSLLHTIQSTKELIFELSSHLSLQNPAVGGFGLFSIQERMLDLGGKLMITSQPGSGCKAVLTLPFQSDKAEI